MDMDTEHTAESDATPSRIPPCLCGKPGLVAINGMGACEAHLDYVMGQALDGVREAVRRVTSPGVGHE
jgi:hypothetical protein